MGFEYLQLSTKYDKTECTFYRLLLISFITKNSFKYWKEVKRIEATKKPLVFNEPGAEFPTLIEEFFLMAF